MAQVQDILILYRQGFSRRKIARTLGMNRETVSRHLRLALEPTVLSTESSRDETPSKPAISPTGSAGRKNACEPLRAVVLDKLQSRLSIQRIYQDLQSEHGFHGSYDSVKRLVRRLGQTVPLPFRRMECEPGEEAQVDFGKGAPVKRLGGRTKCPHLFRMILSFSRKGYSEVVWRQDTETFLRCLENAFHALGGVPRTLVIDNLKAGVLHADWYDPEINPRLRDFCQHYGTVLLPTKPRMPRHKGKIEGGIDYCQENALKGRTFEELAGENDFLTHWESHIADTRIHGTTRQQVKKLFEQQERSALLPLPSGLFPFFQEGRRSVHRDGHVEVDKAYYSVPPEYTGQSVWVRYDSKLVRVLNSRMQPIAVHCKLEPGRFSTDPVHIHKEKISGVERGAEYHLRRTQLIGPWSHLWAKTMLTERGIPGVRVLVGFISLTHRYSDRQLENACQTAMKQGCYHLRSLRHLLQTPGEQPTLAFMDHHPMIRPMKDYQDLVAIDFGPEERTRIIPFPTSEPNDEKAGNVPRFDDTPIFTGDETHDGKSQIHAQTASTLGTRLESGSPPAGGIGQPTEPPGIPGTAHWG